MSPLLLLTAHFAALSLLAVGGVNAILPEVHRVAVETHRWVTPGQFKDLFAIAQAAPGPNMLIVTLIGWQVGGLGGALAATAATCGPAGALTYLVARAWDRFREAAWRRAVEAGLAPLTVGLVLATGWLVARTAEAGVAAHLLTAGAVVAFLGTRLNPLWLLAAGGVLGLAGLV